ncbi:MULTISPECIES: AraC family transcriptional regulator [unclassified Arcicella]|uniref:helix-turn-helix domain-containing protein n=1 Tax=unclassified Arcicella TaxID=2644986 RepID=UPI002858766E|nr:MULTISPECIES: AraC family transcriptional regulator [unclassified Arcicella]MDR6560331.1 AraC-like DNA-binding protein [Arcicella sp. BE51]MDR6810063.1 AraC-like DNA-binding protein [Arcicella sp. BE140]MDR6821412.1 AraC-like DNA-binding protein [Arcicella sp. BE139]
MLEYFKSEIVRIVYVIGIIVGVFSFPYLKNKNKANIFLSLHFLSMGIFALYYLSTLKNKDDFFVALLYGIIIPLSFLVRPFGYWYVKFMLLKKVRFNKWDFLIILPALLSLIETFPFIIAPMEHKLKIAKFITHDINNIFVYAPTFLFNFKFYFVLRPIFNFALCLAQIHLLYKYVKGHSLQKTIFTSTLQWLWVFSILSIVLTITLATLSLLVRNNFDISLNAGLFINDLMDYAIFIYFLLNVSIFFFPKILYGISDEGEEFFIEDTLAEVKIEKSNKPNFKLDDARLAEINAIIETYFLEDKPYLNDNFTIIELSETLNIPIHHLSYYFNYHLLKKFTDYKNEWRVNYAIQLLKDGILKKYTIEQLYHEAGFSTKSNFYRVFRLHTGKTPIEYMEEIKN